MLYNIRWVVVPLIAASLQLLVQPLRSASTTDKEKAAKVERFQDKGPARISLSEKAVERLGIETIPVHQARLTRKQMVVGEVVVLPKQVAAPTTTTSVGIRVSFNEGNQQKIARDQSVRVFPLGSDNKRTSVTARVIEMPTAGHSQKESGILYFAIDNTDHGLLPEQRVQVEFSMLGEETLQKIVPYSSVLYDIHGDTWTYTNPTPLTFIRHSITIAYIEGDQAILSQGPSDGTPVVTIGVAELYGVEMGIGK